MEILKNMLEVAGYLKKYIRDYINELNSVAINEPSFNKNEYIEKLTWLKNISKYLCNKIGLVIHNHKTFNNNNIIIQRSSYKFCNYNYECKFNYCRNNKYKGCIAQHFVHNLVHTDVIALIEYINSNQKFNYNEIRKCIDTISFVINHMHDELEHLKYFNPDTYESLHREMTPVENKYGKKNKNRYHSNRRRWTRGRRL